MGTEVDDRGVGVAVLPLRLTRHSGSLPGKVAMASKKMPLVILLQERIGGAPACGLCPADRSDPPLAATLASGWPGFFPIRPLPALGA